MEYLDDLKEIMALIHVGLEAGGHADLQACLSRLTHPMDDPYRMARAAHICAAVKADPDFMGAMEKLAGFCGAAQRSCARCPVNKYCNAAIAAAQSAIDPTAPKLIDLFCGAGGLSLGFAQEGYMIALANDIESCCIDTYMHNHPEIPSRHIVHGDINDVMGNLTALARFSAIDVLAGGPPCQGFSMANRQRLLDDPRNHLYKSYIEALKLIGPRFFVMENVKGMLSAAPQAIADFKQAGYTVSAKVLNAKEYGIPQNRVRLIFIGNRVGRDNDAVFARIEQIGREMPPRVLADALYGLKPLKASRIKTATGAESDETGRTIDRATGLTNGYIQTINQGRSMRIVLNHKARYNNDRDIEIFSRLNPGDRSDDPKIADIMPYARRNGIFKDKYFKLEPNKVCKTITAHMKFDCNMYIHPAQARGLTPREAARIQSYPDDYFFRGAYTKTYMQIGNSVPPMLGRIIAKAIKEQL